MGLFSRNRIPEGIDPQRIPPGQTLTAPDKWPLLHFGPVPKTDLKTWNLKVFGELEQPVVLTWEQFKELPTKEITADIHCVTAWSRLGDRWTGVPIQALLELVKPLKTAAPVTRIPPTPGSKLAAPEDPITRPSSRLIRTGEGEAPAEPPRRGSAGASPSPVSAMASRPRITSASRAASTSTVTMR